MSYSASRREKAGSVSLIAPLASQARLITFRVLAGPLLHSFRFTRPRNLFIFNRSHTLVFDPSATHSFRTLCALFQKHRGGGIPSSSQNGTHPQRPGSVVVASPSRRIQMC